MKGPEGTHAWTVTVGAKGQIVIPKGGPYAFFHSAGGYVAPFGR